MVTVLDKLVKSGKLTKEALVDLIIGKKVIIVPSRAGFPSSNHPYTPNAEYTVILDRTTLLASINQNNITATTTLSSCLILNGNRSSAAIYLHELSLVESPSTKQELKKELDELIASSETKKKELTSKIELLEELGLEEFDEKVISVVSVIGKINPKLKAGEKLELATQLKDSFK